MENVIYYYVITKIAVEPANISRFFENAQINGFVRIYEETGQMVWRRDGPTT